MNCIECKATNPENSRYCNQCGAVLGRSLEETVQKKIRDRKAVELDITESVAARLMKWTGWVTKAGLVVVALFGLLLGKSYYDVRSQVKAGETEIGTAVAEGKKDIEAVKQETASLKDEVDQVRSDIEGYKQTNIKIATLQKQLLEVKDQVLDLSTKTLKVKTLETTGAGHSGILFGNPGCDPVPKDSKLGYCAQGSPPVLTQISVSGESAPVASRSPIGFQDTSAGAKPACAANNRGTFYVEKGATDKPFLCVQKNTGAYAWMEVVTR
jgi:cell division protein FtsB